MKFLRCSAHTWDASRYSYCSGWLAIGCINVRLLLWSSMMNRLLPRTLAALSGIIVYHPSIQCQLSPHLGMICHDQWAISIHEFGINLELIPNTQKYIYIYSLLGSYALIWFSMQKIHKKNSVASILPTPGPSNRHFFSRLNEVDFLQRGLEVDSPAIRRWMLGLRQKKMEAKCRGVVSFHSFWWWRQVEFLLRKGYKGCFFHFMHMFWWNWNLYLYFPWSDLGAF